jgi:hypothetical protein
MCVDRIVLSWPPCCVADEVNTEPTCR